MGTPNATATNFRIGGWKNARKSSRSVVESKIVKSQQRYEKSVTSLSPLERNGQRISQNFNETRACGTLIRERNYRAKGSVITVAEREKKTFDEIYDTKGESRGRYQKSCWKFWKHGWLTLLQSGSNWRDPSFLSAFFPFCLFVVPRPTVPPPPPPPPLPPCPSSFSLFTTRPTFEDAA